MRPHAAPQEPVRVRAASPDRWNAPYPDFAYSESRDGTLRRCARAYYHATFTSWRGWDAVPGSDAWLAYRCKRSTPLAAAVGAVVHDAATRCVQALVAGRGIPSAHELRREAGDALNAMWANSRARRQAFLRRPSDLATPMLQEVLYREGPSAEMLARARAKLDRTLVNLVACDEIWSQVVTTPPAGVIIPERFLRFILEPEGIHVYAAPDLVLVQPGQRPVIVDYKSSAADGVIDQILTYSVAVRDGMQLDVGDGCIGQVVALDADPAQRVSRFAVTPEEIDEAADRIRANVARMHALLADVAANQPKPFEEFAQTDNARTCRGCTYRAVCWPELHSIVGSGREPTPPGRPGLLERSVVR